MPRMLGTSVDMCLPKPERPWFKRFRSGLRLE